MKFKGYIPKKSIQFKPDLGSSIDSVIKQRDDLENLKKDVVKTVDEKIVEVDTKIENAETILDKKIEDVDKTIEEAKTTLNETVKQAIDYVKEVKQGEKGADGKDAEPVDTKKLKQEILAEIPKPEKFDKKALIKEVVKAIPQNKASLKIIQETIASDPMAIIDKIMALPNFKLKTSNIDGLEQTFNAFRSQLSRGYLHGGGDTVVAGTGISITTNPNGSKTITNTGVVVDADKVKVSSTDTTANYLENKILAGSNISITKENSGANEDLKIAVTGVVLSGTALLLDQTTPQTVINGTPTFNVGLKSNALLEVNLNSATISHLTGTGIALNGADNSVVRFGMSSYGIAGTSAYASRQARGTGASPSASQSGDRLISLEGWGYGATGYSVASQISFRGNASENWSDTAHGTYASIWTTPNTTIVPNEKLRIAGASGTTTIYNPADSTTAIQFNKADGTTNVLNIDTTNGRVGIGTTAPSYTLQVAGSAYVTGGLYTGSIYLDSTPAVGFYTPNYNMNFQAARNNGSIGDIVFNTNNAGALGGTEKMRITSIGNVGIGTTAPNSYLAGTAGLSIYNSSVPGFSLGNTIGYWNINKLNGDLRFYDSTATAGTRITFQAGGNVGIGTTSPTAYLHLKAGTATANTAPLKFTAGTNLTTAEAGAVEWDGTNLFVTQTTGPTRKTIAYTTDITIANAEANSSITPAADGTYANPTSITIKNGIITAIS